MIRTLSRSVVAVACLSALAACFSSSSGSPGLPPDDGAVPGDAVASDDATASLDATVEAAASDEAGTDALAPADATVESAASDEAGMDAGLPETGTAPPDAGADVAPVPVAGCIPDIPGGHYLFGDHYLRSDGKLFYAPPGSHTLVTNAGTGLALLGITEVTQQADHACGLGSDGTAWCWPLFASGGNANGDLGNGSFNGTNPGIGVATQVVTSVPDGGPPVYLTGAIHISTASDTQYTFPTCAIRSDRTVWCWGASTAETGGPDGLFWGTTGTTQSLDVATPIAASASDGGPPPTVLADQISVGFRHACILANGKVSCWGQNVAGNLGIGNASLTFQEYPAPVMAGFGLPATVDEIGSGFDFSCARAGGSVWCWGASGQSQVGNPGVPPSICNSNYCVPVPAPVQQSAKDGGLTVVPDGGTDQSPLVGAVSIHVGYLFACALDASGTAWCWGASGGAVAYESEATPYTSTQVPYSGINELTLYGEESSSGLRYLTAAGQYVSGNQVVTPFCQ